MKFQNAWLAIFLVVINFLAASCESKLCLNSGDNCPPWQSKCCGTRKYPKKSRICSSSCVDFLCETNKDCGELRCCEGKCSENSTCLPFKNWGPVVIVVISLIALLITCRVCDRCRRKKLQRQQNHFRRRSMQVENNAHPAVLLNLYHDNPVSFSSSNDNAEFPMSLPSYDSITQSNSDITEATDEPPPSYSEAIAGGNSSLQAGIILTPIHLNETPQGTTLQSSSN